MLKLEFDRGAFNQFLKEVGFESDIIRKVNKKAAFLIEQDVKNYIFKNEEDSSGEKWKRLKNERPRNRRGKRKTKNKKKRKSSKILQNTGRLKRSTSSDFDSREVTVGTNVPYAEYHQFGTGNIPKREFLYVRDSVVDKIFKCVQKEYDSAIAKLKG